MFEYFSAEVFNSTICPEVSFRLRKMSKGRRTSFNLKVAALLDKKNKLQQALLPISEEITRAEEQARHEPCSCQHALDPSLVSARLEEIKRINPNVALDVVDACHSSITRRCMVEKCGCREPKPDPAIGGYEAYRDIMEKLINLETDELGVERLRFFVASVQGLKIDGQEATVDALIEDGPEALIDEVSSALGKLLALTPEEALGFRQPTTGDAAAVGQA